MMDKFVFKNLNVTLAVLTKSLVALMIIKTCINIFNLINWKAIKSAVNLIAKFAKIYD